MGITTEIGLSLEQRMGKRNAIPLRIHRVKINLAYSVKRNFEKKGEKQIEEGYQRSAVGHPFSVINEHGCSKIFVIDVNVPYLIAWCSAFIFSL